MRPSVIALSIGMLTACGGLAYVHATRDEPEQAASTAVAATATPNATNASADTAAKPPPDVPETTALPSAPERPENVEQWIKDTQDTDPKIRAAAIAKLASAPIAQALPALREIIDSGEPEVDRHIALRSLHAMALREGDSDGQARDVMRRAIYHGDDEGVSQTAQSLLDDVEAAFAEQRPQPSPPQ